MEIAVGMVGGGPGSFIGETHRHALRYDGRFKLQAGAFTRSVESNDEFGGSLGLDAARRYGSWRDLLAEEVQRDDGIEAVIIATPNDTHHEIAAAALDAGLHVICDKPVAVSLRQALDLRVSARLWICGTGNEERGSSSHSRTTTPAMRWSARRDRWCATVRSARSGSFGSNLPKDGRARLWSEADTNRPNGEWTRFASDLPRCSWISGPMRTT